MRQTFPPISTKFEIHRRRQIPFIAYQNTSILPLYVLGKRIDVPSCIVEFNKRKVDWHDERSLGWVTCFGCTAHDDILGGRNIADC